jgi:Spy/CpxP family protein refolding chaperone
MKKYAVLVAMVLLTFSARLYSEPDDAKMLHKFMGKLNLTEEQKKDVDKIRFDMEKQTIDQKANLATARLELQQLFKAENPDKSAIEKKINEMADLGVQLRMTRLNAWFAVNKLLTQEQQKTWKKVLLYGSAMQGRKMGMRHQGKHPMPPHQEEPMPKE